MVFNECFAARELTNNEWDRSTQGKCLHEAVFLEKD